MALTFIGTTEHIYRGHAENMTFPAKLKGCPIQHEPPLPRVSNPFKNAAGKPVSATACIRFSIAAAGGWHLRLDDLWARQGMAAGRLCASVMAWSGSATGGRFSSWCGNEISRPEELCQTGGSHLQRSLPFPHSNRLSSLSTPPAPSLSKPRFPFFLVRFFGPLLGWVCFASLLLLGPPKPI